MKCGINLPYGVSLERTHAPGDEEDGTGKSLAIRLEEFDTPLSILFDRIPFEYLLTTPLQTNYAVYF